MTVIHFSCTDYMDAFVPSSISGILGSYRVTGSVEGSSFRKGSPVNVPSGSILAMISYSASSVEYSSLYNVWICEGGSACMVAGQRASFATVSWPTGSSQITTTANDYIAVILWIISP